MADPPHSAGRGSARWQRLRRSRKRRSARNRQRPGCRSCWVAGNSGLFAIRYLPFRSGCEADRIHKRVFGARRHGGAERRKDHSPSIMRSLCSYRPTFRPRGVTQARGILVRPQHDALELRQTGKRRQILHRRIGKLEFHEACQTGERTDVIHFGAANVEQPEIWPSCERRKVAHRSLVQVEHLQTRNAGKRREIADRRPRQRQVRECRQSYSR